MLDSNKLFEQVYDYVTDRIHRGEWKEHEKLPSIRSLAKELDVHRLTVFRACQLLKQHGKVYVKEKTGYYVHPHSNSRWDRHSLQDPIISSYVHESHLSEIHQVQATYQFSKALIDPNLLPNLYLAEYVKKVFDLYPKVLATYSSLQGDDELRDSLVHYFTNRHQFYLSAEEVLITSGAGQAIDLVARVLVKPRDAVLLERPTYSAAIDVFRQQGANIIPIDIYSHGYDLEQVEKVMKEYKPRLFYLNPTFHNPTGYTVPSEQRKQLVELAEQYRCVLVEDDPFHDIYFDKEPPLPLFAYDTEGVVIYIRSFSKYVAPGLRIAAVTCRPFMMKVLLKAKSLSDNGSPLLNQKIFLHYFSSSRLQQHLAKLRTALSIRKEIMEEELSATNWKWMSPSGGLNLWIQFPEEISMENLMAKSREQSLSFVPGTICDPLREFHSWVRLSYSYINEKQLRDGMQRLISLR